MQPRAGARRSLRASVRSRDEPEAERCCDGLRACGCIEPVARLAEVCADGLRADAEPAADLLVLQPFCEEPEHVELALRELAAGCEVLGERGVEVGATRERRFERANEVRERC